MINSVTGLAGPIGIGAVAPTRLPFAPSAASVATPDFAAVLANISSEAVDTLRAGEAAAISGIQGNASVQEVVRSIMTAEETLQMALAIRDKVVSAYQEISRMAI